VTDLSAGLTVPSRPAVYIRGRDSSTELRDGLISEARGKLGWPEPAAYMDGGPADQTRSRLAALIEAIAAGQHDGVFAAHPSEFGDLAAIEAFDRHCRQHSASTSWRRRLLFLRGGSTRSSTASGASLLTRPCV
jgi:hypothetical protein